MSDVSNPATYRQMSEPFESPAAADAALAAFDADLRELRKKHKITDLLVVMHGTYMQDGAEHEFWSSAICGNVLMAEGLAAYAYGREKLAARQRIAKLMAEAATAREGD